MATGLTIRDFFKEYREATYSNQGSILLSEIEKNAYRAALTIEIVAYDAPRAINNKTLPENTHWGYATHFRGSTVTLNQPIKFVKFRAFDIINDGIWQYHQHTENVRLTKAFSESAANSILQSELLSETQTKIVDFYLQLISNLPEQIEEDLQWILSFTYRPEEPESNGLQDYTGFPIASPFPDIVKFKTDIPASFKFRLETWYLVNPAVYIVANPTDTGDETEGEDEYPQPDPGDGDGDGAEFPPASAPDPNADPRDGDPSAANGSGVWNVPIRFFDPGNNAFCNNIPRGLIQLRGFPDEPPQKEFTGPTNPNTGGRPGRYFTSIASAAFSGDCGNAVDGLPVFFADND